MNVSIITTDIRSEHDVMLTRQRARQIACLLDFDMHDQTRIATAVSEIARNALQHAGGGKVEFLLSNGMPQTFHIKVRDRGPGIADIESILNPRDTSASERGHSLRGVRCLMDVFTIDTDLEKGTVITLGKQRYRLLPPIDHKDMGRISSQLLQHVSEDPLAESQRQNQELLHALEELRLQQEERDEHLKQIESLNARLRRSVQATHHRVKNNLQLISALVDVQLDVTEDSGAHTAMNRIGQHARALAALHDILTQETHANVGTDVISAKAALDKLVPLLQDTTGGRQIQSRIDDFPILVGQSASLALLISELVSNALKHGSNDIVLQITVLDDVVRLEVCNDGCGFPPGFDWRQEAKIGLNLIDSTGRHDLKGIVSYENRAEGGARVVVTFPVSAAGSADFADC